MRIPAPGDIAARRPDGDTFLTSNQSWDHLVFNICQSGFLGLSKAFDVIMRKADIGLEPFRHKGKCGLNLCFCKLDITIVIIKFTGIFQRRLIATLLNFV